MNLMLIFIVSYDRWIVAKCNVNKILKNFKIYRHYPFDLSDLLNMLFNLLNLSICNISLLIIKFIFKGCGFNLFSTSLLKLSVFFF
ncbi:UNVERIFIED_CONTAM: hypothetical protein NCL1_44240 [Trichonephila clavipes]